MGRLSWKREDASTSLIILFSFNNNLLLHCDRLIAKQPFIIYHLLRVLYKDGNI